MNATKIAETQNEQETIWSLVFNPAVYMTWPILTEIDSSFS